MSGTLLRRATVRPGVEVDLLIVEGRIDAGPPAVATEVVDLNGRPVVAGLVDHHVHLLALAASWASVDLTPTALARAGGLDVALRAARARKPGGWLRGVGYDVAASGALNCLALDAVDVGPVRVQDRTGIQWILDRRGLRSALRRRRGGHRRGRRDGHQPLRRLAVHRLPDVAGAGHAHRAGDLGGRRAGRPAPVPGAHRHQQRRTRRPTGVRGLRVLRPLRLPDRREGRPHRSPATDAAQRARPGASRHVMGTARMGADPSTSVVSPEQRLWGVDNVWYATRRCS